MTRPLVVGFVALVLAAAYAHASERVGLDARGSGHRDGVSCVTSCR